MAGFFKLPKQKKFTYKPRFYNEREELRKERFEKIKQEVEAEKDGKQSSLNKGDLVNYIQMRRKAQKKSNLRVLLILTLLLLLFYYFFYK
ncbi:MAG TPA: hypothetical protein DCQ26_19810 [Marinilabiliales bacterium]|jgi:hypothetical protein|nr:MAG: hypothetical protein A2W95_17990 [Bacteroidetes bacterium GWA2_40_14]OFX57176.1 MAG: hypothetical protein A2W84_15120 [Bacteroidetes bacterium GWC2_40_13]OFX72278.1 MAG: hypothetical protein A2W96_17735 [Bacteroidetes bacterium GWD2_40_43]OFX90474.1 MAG: hypothetical protein A2W97_01665 [Bacteroidetes bacterium GWE2_40_63]OFY17280.1 MAG: hypothetical protein A2W88_15200 [Bacteroidetes bacterium GWF2_40_13]OFZ29112.1 MAG: hypothetical protein A2437_16165 [Bacteroidetes bacterium RIFOXYC